MDMTMNFSAAERQAVELSVLQNEKTLASNFIDIVTDCCGDGGAKPKTRLMNQFPIISWLLGTPLTAEMRAKLSQGICGYHKNASGKYEVDLPATFWSTIPQTDVDACCWPTMDFAKCGGSVQLEMLCLKDCKDIQDDLMWGLMRAGQRGAVPGLAGANENLNAINDRVAQLSMAFYTAYTATLGSLDTTTNILRPFHGLLEVLENPAVAHISGANVLNAFDAWACRMAILGGNYSDYIIFVHPLLKQTLLREIKPGQFGELPAGWTRNGDELRFMGVRIMEDMLVPVDFTTGTSEAWILNADATGIFLATDLIPRGDFVRYSGHEEQAKADGCGRECTFYYNIGAVFNNNATRLAVINDIPLSGVCLGDTTADLTGLLQPETLIPRGVKETP